VWTMGYSGGAEFITNELNASRRNSWRTGGGSIMVGGGGAEKRIEAPDSIKPIPMF
jgi:serine protease, subtilase family